jgi:hypothetical protein
VIPVRTTPVGTVGADLCLALLPVREACLPNLGEVEDMSRARPSDKEHKVKMRFGMIVAG